MLVEVCANSLESALNAQEAGANRIELCSELAVGGITPSYGLLKAVRERVTIPVHVLIRPRSGDFTFSNVDFDIMKKNIALCVEMGFHGIVSGVLHNNFTLDEERTEELVKASGSLNFTFHRAFDWVKDPFETAMRLEAMGIDYILTSGQQKSALEGIGLLHELHQSTSTCKIMPGSGINPKNVHQFKEKEFEAIHLSGVRFEKTLDEIPKVSMNSPTFLHDDGIGLSHFDVIRDVVSTVK
ncbi:copper homeostasis protein CutC [Costertonia aggregata]|uniref:PF03932 family protein CutC n=1 Tax=Costertonia aggregata TaxID=343403 RepID=A0A7H9AMB1_9FLAO|nr:copper homeostasis protein CutC [Costertonia aggregata]QLG44592.1 copper homeostasis protein CutC [Costertonia aggregata]